jgi:tripartite-type tricarboxylate transporter receptor subunit TctC
MNPLKPATGRRAALATLTLLIGVPGVSWAQGDGNWPTRPLRIVVGSSPGGVIDISARLVGARLADALRQTVVVDNRPGAGGVVAADLVAKAAPDGHTLLSISASHVIAPTLIAKLPFDPLKDFAGVALTVVVPNVLVVSPGTGVKSVKELIAIAQTRPGQLLFSSGGIGTSTHFAAELFANLAQLNVRHVPFKGIPEALADAVSGRAQFTMSPVSAVAPSIREKRVLALGVTTGARSAALPDVPTLAEAGVAGYRWDPWFGILAPAQTPRLVVNRLNQEIDRARLLPELAQNWANMGAELMPSMQPAAIDKYLAAQLIAVAKLANAAGIKPE